MRTKRCSMLALTVGMLWACQPVMLLAQTTGGGTTGGATTGGATTGGGGLGGLGGATAAAQQAARVDPPKIQVQATSSGTGSATGVPSNSNPFVSSYGDALSMGLPSKFLTGSPAKPTATFGQGIYTKTTTTTGSAAASTTASQAHGFSSTGTTRAPVYSTVLSDDLPLVVHKTSALQTSVQGIIDRSTYIKNKSGITVTVTGNTVDLTGQVTTERERRTIEGMVRMTPGVRDVRNALQVVQAK